MQSPVINTSELQKPSQVLVSSKPRPDQTKTIKKSPVKQAALSLPDDLVTLSPASLEASASPDKKTSIAVSVEEKKALLNPAFFRKDFSVYG
ncbi:MAG TPA: hypothetical protein VGJ93_00510 [Desulfuromonadaceae bacterium]|jgi:hypothetical protein